MTTHHSIARSHPLHHIHRIDHAPSHTYAWVVQVQRRGRITLRRFSDGRYGGRRAALAAAIRCRDSLLKNAPERRYALWRRNQKRRNNTSGIVGVGRYVSREHARGRIIERVSWQAFWDGPDGKRHSRKFSVNLHGEKQARELAQRVRAAAMRAIYKIKEA